MKWFFRLFSSKQQHDRVQKRRDAFKVVRDVNQDKFDALATYDQRLQEILSNLEGRKNVR